MEPMAEDLHLLEDSDDEEQGTVAHVNDAFDRTYRDERSWEFLAEDEHGRLVSARHTQKAQRQRPVQDDSRVRRGLIRYLQLVVDMSATCANATDFRPNRATALVALAKTFISEFFDQNPLSQLGLMTMHNGCAHRLSELSASPENHRKVLEQNLETGGSVSLQNVIEQAVQAAQPTPAHGHRECLILLSSLTTCDPGNINDAIERAKKCKVRVSIIGLSAEMFISRKICQDTGGTYRVALSESHLEEVIMAQCSPPPATASSAIPNLVRMAFPSKDADGPGNACFVGESCVLKGGAYTCPKCLAKSPELPCQCHVCGITLISSPHLARSYHHLFPLPTFLEQNILKADTTLCFGCSLPCAADVDRSAEMLGDGQEPSLFRCPACQQAFCAACDIFIHEQLHNCPGCECTPS